MSDLKALELSAVKLLSSREHGRVELEQKLIQRGFAVSDIQEVLDQLQAQGLLSEERYIESYINSRRNKGYGPIRIQLELEQKQADSTLVKEILDLGDAVWYQQALKVYQKKYGDTVPADVPEKMKRMRFLQYRGFNQDHINHVLDELRME